MRVLEKDGLCIRKMEVNEKKPDEAEFIRMQKVPGDKSIAFFIVKKEDHPKLRSTVSERSLKRLELKKYLNIKKHISGIFRNQTRCCT